MNGAIDICKHFTSSYHILSLQLFVMLSAPWQRLVSMPQKRHPAQVLYANTRQMSVFESKWRRAKKRRNEMKYKKRANPLHPDQGNDLPSESVHVILGPCKVSLSFTCIVFVFPVLEYASAAPTDRVYTWGMACFGALGVPEYCAPKLRDRRSWTQGITRYVPNCQVVKAAY